MHVAGIDLVHPLLEGPVRMGPVVREGQVLAHQYDPGQAQLDHQGKCACGHGPPGGNRSARFRAFPEDLLGEHDSLLKEELHSPVVIQDLAGGVQV